MEKKEISRRQESAREIERETDHIKRPTTLEEADQIALIKADNHPDHSRPYWAAIL
jgi:hypothetical protein